MSHGHMRHFGWNVFAVVEYRHHATVEALHAAAILLQLMRYVIILIKLLCMYVCMYVCMYQTFSINQSIYFHNKIAQLYAITTLIISY